MLKKINISDIEKLSDIEKILRAVLNVKNVTYQDFDNIRLE